MSSKILVIDPVPHRGLAFSATLRRANHLTQGATSLEEAKRLIQSLRPQMIFASCGPTDKNTIAQLRACSGGQGIPIICLNPLGDPETTLSGLQQGANDVLCPPYEEEMILARLRNLLRLHSPSDTDDDTDILLTGLCETPQRFMQQRQISLIANDEADQGRLVRDLGGLQIEAIHRISLEKAMAGHRISATGVDLHLIRAEGLCPSRLLRLISELRSRGGGAQAAIALLGDDAKSIRPLAACAYDIGIEAVLHHAMPTEELHHRLNAVLRDKQTADLRRERLHQGLRLASIDPLTGLHNRRYAYNRLQAIATSAAERHEDFAVMIADIDRFKRINDLYGHGIGDEILCETAKRLGRPLRNGDLLSRIGGEEFLLALPATTLIDAQEIAQKIRTEIERFAHLTSAGPLEMTISIGLAHSQHILFDPSRPIPAPILMGEMIDQADLALRGSKRAGRNKVTLSHHYAA